MAFLPCTPGQGVHLWCSCLVPSRYSHGLDGSTICICCFSIFSTTTCLPCLLHPSGSNYICNFSIFSIHHLFACFTTHTGSEPACSCMCYFFISVPRRPFTCLETSKKKLKWNSCLK
jgi:hypothetical protein